MAVAEQREQDQLERVALADDGALDLVEDLRRLRPQLVQLHQMRSSASTTRRSAALEMPGA